MEHRGVNCTEKQINTNLFYGVIITVTSLLALWRLKAPASTVYSGAGQRKHEISASLAFVIGIRRWPVNSPHKGPVTRKMFSFDNVIMDPIHIWSGDHINSLKPRDTYVCRLIGSALFQFMGCRQLDAKSLPILTGFQLDHKKQTSIKIESELIIFFQKKWNCLLWHVDHLAQTQIYWKRCHNESLNFILLVWIQDRVTRRSIIIIIDVESLGRKVGNVYVSLWKVIFYPPDRI